MHFSDPPTSACERPRKDDQLSLNALRSEIRIAQSVSVVRQMPTIIAGNAIGAGIAYYAIRSNQSQFAPEPILVCILALLMPMAWSWLKLRNRPRPKSVSQRRINGIIVYSAALGLTWGGLEAVYLSTAPFPVVAFATTAAGFLAAGSVAALFTVPQACLAYSAPMLVSGIVVASLSTDPNHWPLLMILVLMSAGVCGFLRANWRQFSQNVLLSAELAQTVDGQSKLLKQKEDAENALREANLRLQALAARDPLTGVANLRRFDEALQAELSRARRNNSCLSLLLMDADEFKKLNDTHGHQLGDECLRLVADIMKDTFKRPGDVIARYGGEEFAVILPETEPPNAYVLAERLRTRIAEAGSDLGLTVSVGATTSLPTAREETPETLLNRADRALYRAKENGRNRTEIQTLRQVISLRAVS
jgi:diguanylate cyclase (GGDEF)-like protein